MTTTTHEVPMTKSKRAALHLRYDTAEDITLQLLLDTEDLPANARSVIGEIVTRREGEAEVAFEQVLAARSKALILTLQLLRDAEDLPANARSVIGEIVTQEVAQAETRDDETARQNELWDAGTEARYQDELRQMAHDDETRSS